jgi:hypothetical protein
MGVTAIEQALLNFAPFSSTFSFFFDNAVGTHITLFSGCTLKFSHMLGKGLATTAEH